MQIKCDEMTIISQFELDFKVGGKSTFSILHNDQRLTLVKCRALRLRACRAGLTMKKSKSQILLPSPQIQAYFGLGALGLMPG